MNETTKSTSFTPRFQFVEDLYDGTTPAISCDGLVPGAALDLTHWQGNRTPGRYKADTSTEIALNFVASPEAVEKWSQAVVVNNHFDTDGVLSIWVLLDPDQAMARRELLVAAAESGDFDEWPALDQGLWLDAAIRALASGAADDAAAYQTVLPQLPGLIDTLDERRDLWGPEWDALQAAVAALESGGLRATRVGPVGLMAHAAGQPEAPGPLLAGASAPASGAICWPSNATTARTIIATSVPTTPGPTPWSARCCRRPKPARWRPLWGRIGQTKDCPE